MNLRKFFADGVSLLDVRSALGDPALDDPEHDDGEPTLTDEDLAGRLEGCEQITSHILLRDDDIDPELK